MVRKNIHKNHRARMREKYLKYGESAFSTSQLVEMFLYNTIRRCDTSPAAVSLIQDFPKGKLFAAEKNQLMKSEGVGTVTANNLKIALDMSRRVMIDAVESDSLNNDFRKRTYLYLQFMNSPNESLGIVFLSEKDRVLFLYETKVSSLKSPDDILDYIIDTAKKFKSKKIIMCHTHGEKSPVPSPEDVYLTSYLKTKLSSKRINLLEHYVVTNTDCVLIEDI